MNQPGFCLLTYDEETRSVKIDRTSYVNNHHADMTHGQKLRATANEVRSYINDQPDVFVREQALGGGANVKTCLILAKVVGVSDYLAEIFAGKAYVEIFPTTIKRILTGDCNAKKDVVANALKRWVGDHDYKVDDESDAVAVGVAWLIQNGYLDGLPEE